MADDIVSIGLAVDSRDVKAGTKNLNEFGRQGKETKKATDSLMSSVKSLVGAYVGFQTLRSVVDQHREFTKAISELSSITGATGRDLQFYKEQALDLGRTTTFSAQEVATAFKLVASAKPDLLESKEALASVTGEVLTLAEASGMTLPDAAKALGGSLNQFGADASEASRFINVLAAGAKLGASEINDTSEAMKNSGAVASSLGLSFEETNAAIQALASVSIKGAEAGTGLRGVLLKLSTQSRDEFNPEIVGLATALENLQAAHLTTAEKADIFGQESITAATALITQAGAVEELTKSLHGTQTAYEQASINTDNLDGDMKALSSSWSGAALVLGDVFNPALRATTQFLTKVGTVASTIAIEIGDLGDMLGAYAAIAVSVMTLDFEGASAIIDARKEERRLTDEKIAKLWEEKDAVEQTAEVKQAAATAEIESQQKIAEIRSAAVESASIRREEEAAKLEEQRMSQWENDVEWFDAEFERDQSNYDRKLAAANDFHARLFNLETGSVQASYDFATAIRDMDYKGAVQHGALMLGNLAKSSKMMFGVQKAFALAQTAIALPTAVLESFKNGGGYPWGLVPAGLMLAQGLQQISAITSASFGGGVSTPSIGGSTSPSAPAGSLPAGSTALPGGEELPTAPPTRELRVVVESDGPHSDGMRQFAENLAETLKDMGSNTNLVIA